MATQFYKSLDEWENIKRQQNQLVQRKLSEYNHTEITDIDSLKTLAGINNHQRSSSIEQQSIDRGSRLRFIQENNIKHGTPRWFKVMYARPELTGEDPFGE